MTQYNTGIICSCGSCGQRWPLLIGTADKRLFWPRVFETMEETVCPQCGSNRWRGTMLFTEPKGAADAEVPS